MSHVQHITPEIKNSIRALYLGVDSNLEERENIVGRIVQTFGDFSDSFRSTPEYGHYTSGAESRGGRKAAAVGLVTVLSLGIENPKTALNSDGIAYAFETVRKVDRDQHLHVLESQFHARALEYLPRAVHEHKNRLLEEQVVDVVNGDVHVLLRLPYVLRTVAGEKLIGEAASRAITRRSSLAYADRYDLFARELYPELRRNGALVAYFARRHFVNSARIR